MSTVLSNDASSRRSFPLDSRAAWVDLTHNKHQHLIPRETIPLGPQHYRPQVPRSHISTPSLGSSQELGIIGHFEPFRGLPNRWAASPGRNERKSLGNLEERSEFMTIYHEHDRRQPLDPKLRFCKTPGPRLSHQPLAEAITYQGKYKASSVHFGPNNIPFGERTTTKMAMQDYDIPYESLYLRKRPTLGFISHSRRWETDPPHYKDTHKIRKDIGREESLRARTPSKYQADYSMNAKDRVTAKFATSTDKSAGMTQEYSEDAIPHINFDFGHSTDSPSLDKPDALQQQSSLITTRSKKTVLSEHHPLLPHKKYDDSSYQRLRKPPLATLGPLELNKSIKHDVFGTLLRLRREYKGDSRGIIPLTASKK
jgi:hypothetical protein